MALRTHLDKLADASALSSGFDSPPLQGRSRREVTPRYRMVSGGLSGGNMSDEIRASFLTFTDDPSRIIAGGRPEPVLANYLTDAWAVLSSK